MVRSGEYYLFETDSEEEEEEEEKKDDEPPKKSAFQVTSSCGAFFFPSFSWWKDFIAGLQVFITEDVVFSTCEK